MPVQDTHLKTLQNTCSRSHPDCTSRKRGDLLPIPPNSPTTSALSSMRMLVSIPHGGTTSGTHGTECSPTFTAKQSRMSSCSFEGDDAVTRIRRFLLRSAGFSESWLTADARSMIESTIRIVTFSLPQMPPPYAAHESEIVDPMTARRVADCTYIAPHHSRPTWSRILLASTTIATFSMPACHRQNKPVSLKSLIQ